MSPMKHLKTQEKNPELVGRLSRAPEWDNAPWAKDTQTNNKPRYVTFTFPGIQYWTYAVHSGQPSLMSIVGVCEDCWIYGHGRRIPEPHNYTLSLQTEMILAGYMIFQTDHEVKISRAFYNKSISKWPLRAKSGYGHRSGVFWTALLELRAASVDEPLIQMKMCVAYINRETRKAADGVPHWFVDALDGKEMLEKGLRLERLKPRPRETYMERMRILVTDIDSNNHANYKTYIRRCHDALCHAVTLKQLVPESTSEQESNVSSPLREISTSENHSGHKQFYPKWLTSDIMKQGVATLRYKFVKESTLGEELSIYLWQEEDQPFWVFFTINREQPLKTEIVFELSMEFFGPMPNL